MSEKDIIRMNEQDLENVSGGNDGMGGNFSVRDIAPKWIEVTASSLNCRYYPNGPIAKTYERGHRLKVTGITTDELWYCLWIYNPQGGECNGYIFKEYTRDV